MRNLGLAAFRLGRYDESAEAFSTVAAAEPKDAQVHVLLGLSLFSLKKFPGAAAAFAPAADAAMADSHAAYAWAFSLAHVPDPQQANRILDQLVTRPLAPDDLSLVCQVFEQTENYEHAISCLQKLEAAGSFAEARPLRYRDLAHPPESSCRGPAGAARGACSKSA